MAFNELVQRAMTIRQQYAEMEREKYGRSWTTEEIALGFVGDVGDLMKLVMAHTSVRQIEDAEQKLAHELADCLWAIIVLAQKTGIDWEQSFLYTMDELEDHLACNSA